MKRDFDLVRKLLLYFEAKPNDTMEECPSIDGYSELEIKYHLLLMDEARLLRCEREVSSSSDRVIKVYPFSLTWVGHEFLDAIKNDTVWNKTKESFFSEGLSMTFDLVKSVAANVAAEYLKRSLP